MIVIKIVFFVAVFIILFLFVKWRFLNVRWIRNLFDGLSITITGKRGKGKDTLMSFISYNKPHNSNVPLHPNTNIIDLKELLIPNLYRQNLVLGRFEPIDFEKYSKFDNPTFISDAGIYFPSYDDSQLKKEYQNLAISYAVWRHLFNGGLHFNVQNYERLWKILREQVEDTIMCLGCVWLPFYCLMRVRYYESPKDCINQLKPIKHHIFGNHDNVEIEESKRFEITEKILLLPRRMIEHDSRYFKKVVFKEENDENSLLRSEISKSEEQKIQK